MDEPDHDAAIEAADKANLYWALYRLLSAVHSARYAAETDTERAILHVTGYTADAWVDRIPSTMPTLESVSRECRADDAHHARTELGERLGIYLTGDEFF
ncbi:MAG: hypothetical protein KGO96_10305 [Elusimicrobia bacterium]|nr:hypothetical protein [Elusimicrobiota bacterium]